MIDVATIDSFFSELSKIAQDAEGGLLPPEFIVGGAGILGGAGLVASPTTRGRLLGYKRAYHGTDPEAAKSIREVGLKRSFGGSGVAGVDALVEGRGDVRELARKNVYVSG
jgi:hypothetical protein